MRGEIALGRRPLQVRVRLPHLRAELWPHLPELRHRRVFIKHAPRKVKCFSINMAGTRLEMLHVLTMATYAEVD